MRDKFVNELAKLQAAIDEVKDLVSTSAPSQPQIQASNQDGADAHISRLERTIDTHSAELDKALQQQTQLLLALKSFFEDKAVALEKEQDADQAEAEATSWPAATLPTAHLTTVLLSAVVSSVVATATIRQRDEQANRQAFATLPAPSGNNNVYSRTEKAIKASSSEVLLLTVEKKTPKATEHVDEVISSGRASGWVSDFARQNVGGVRSASRRISPPTYSRTTSPPRVTSASPHPSATYVQPDPPQPKRQTSTSSYRSVPSPWGWYDDRDWSKKLSMLDTPDPGYAPPPPSHSHSSFASPTILPGPVMSSPSTPAPASSTPENLMCGICQSPLDRSGICPACGQMQASISIF
ncbi:hypothetical protein BU23DRAFT_316814 [Bimuria novae-zelandiae CBS 107.79]|uniref:Uncharacterized protein n=1 Tax=Bimuria novae-zelandiae CBS 107.79 TaxID=1447943 RepID=A0A6A5UPH6_9PLEO|nr:hypothetical protein BU23DRAFT_316814 [Bimuria novae-zelandiae CBS 107.79]